MKIERNGNQLTVTFDRNKDFLILKNLDTAIALSELNRQKILEEAEKKGDIRTVNTLKAYEGYHAGLTEEIRKLLDDKPE